MAYTQSTNGIALVSLEGTLNLWTYLLEKKRGRYYTHVKLVQFTLQNQKTSQIFFVENKVYEDFFFFFAN
jgi:hypothetical protein